MIRLIDEPVFEMTVAEFARLRKEYNDRPHNHAETFQTWLRDSKGWPYTTLGRLKPCGI